MDKQSKEMQELDAWLAEHPMEAEKVLHVIWNSTVHSHEQKACWINGDWQVLVADWHPTTNIAQAFDVVEKMRKEGYNFELGDNYHIAPWYCCFELSMYQESWGYAETPALAICLAAKKAWEAK